MEKRLLLKDSQGAEIAELLSFTYNAKRMGGAPTISATLHSFYELTLSTDDYVWFNGEKYYIKHTPTSSKSNTDARYKYDLEFVSERVMLDDIYFHDASWSSSEPNKAISKGTNFPFVGSVKTLADKINASLAFSNVKGYKVVVSDEFEELEEKFIQFSDVFLSSAIQEFYNTFKIPYYYEWDENENVTFIYVTNASASSPKEIFEYGSDNALLSITKSNANYKIINKCTGVGSSENIPYYYPNISATGEHTFEADKELGSVKINYDILDKHTNLRDGATLVYHVKPDIQQDSYTWWYYLYNTPSFSESNYKGTNSKSILSTLLFSSSGDNYSSKIELVFDSYEKEQVKLTLSVGCQKLGDDTSENTVPTSDVYIENISVKYDGQTKVEGVEFDNQTIRFIAPKTKQYHLTFDIVVKNYDAQGESKIPLNTSLTVTPIRKTYKEDYFTFDDSDKEIGVSLSGVRVTTPKDGGKIVVSETENWIEPQKVLMPSIYRGTKGLERYYEARNEDKISVHGHTYDFGGNIFNNPFVEGRPKEHIITVDDLKPTIKGMLVNDERIDMFRAFAYDVDDNDEIDEKNNYKHPYFYAKLRKLDFNLFEHASEKGEMTISFTSGKCAACNFTVMVDDKTDKNFVQVDGDKVFIGSTALDEQQDTINNEVWIALKKEDSTMGVVMPNATANQKPSVEDTFVITNINLPTSYITHAEKVLEDKIKEYLVSNNDDKFNFSIKFSRIYLAENEGVKNSINENSSLWVKYQNSEVLLYVSSYTYKMVAGEALPEITVELTDTLATTKGVMQNVISQVKMEVMSSISNVDIVAQGARAFIRKDQNDQTVHRLSVNELNVTTNSDVSGELKVGDNASIGGELEVKRKATLKEGLESGSDVTIGDYQELLGEIKGAKVSQDGAAAFKSIRANYLEIFTLIYNQIKTMSGYSVFDDSATIIDVINETDVNGRTLYTLTFEGGDEYQQPFQLYDIVYGYVNKMNNGEYSEYGQSWMNVVELVSDRQVKVRLFPNDEVPSGKNIEPTKNMVIAHRGNSGVGENERKDRQHTFYISSSDGCLYQLLNVTSPILHDPSKVLEDGRRYSNYGSVMGILPRDLFEYVHGVYPSINENQPYFYGRGIIIQDLMLLDYLGQPIKEARYRGVWNKNTAESDNPYVITASTYDTTTHNGSLWQLNADRTTVEPSDSSQDWTKIVSKGDDSSIAAYTIIPDPDKIHLATDGTLSTSTISVKIGEQLPDGTYTEIQDQGELEDKGLTVWYAVDGMGERTMLNISPAAIFELEDGSGRIITEEEGYLLLEGQEIDANAISSHIALYLVDSKGIDRAVSFIWIVKDGEKGEKGEDGKDGKDGESPLLVGATPSNLSVTIDAETGNTIEELEQIVRVFVQRGDNRLRPNDDKDGWVVDYDYDIITGGSDVDDYVELRIEIPAGTPKGDIESVLNLTIYDRDGEVELGRTSITINKPERGIVGPMGNTGPLPYAAGAWNDTTEYPAATDIAPYVLYPNAENGSYYVRTANEIHKGKDGKDLNPAEESNYGSKGGWRVMPQFEVLFVKMLFANFGRLAKAVFHGDYMFSANGLASSGAYGSYDAFVDGNANNNEPMFDKNGRLSGSFVPNLFLDLENGQLKTNKLSETFVVHPSLDENGALLYSKQIELSESHNISVEYAEEPRVISMPYPTEVVDGNGDVVVPMPYEPDGVSSTVIMQPSLGYIQKKDLYLNPSYVSNFDFLQTSVILTADGRLFDARSYKDDVFAPQGEQIFSQTDKDGYFVINGKLTKILILDPTSFVRLRSFTTNAVFNEESTVYKTKYWYVENGEDFAEINMTATVSLCSGSSCTNLTYTFRQSNLFASEGGYGAAYATKFLVDYVTVDEVDTESKPTGRKIQNIIPHYTIETRENGDIKSVEVIEE